MEMQGYVEWVDVEVERTFAASAAAGATSLLVDDGSVVEQAAQVEINGAVYDVAGVADGADEDSPATLTLATGLAGAIDDDEPVTPQPVVQGTFAYVSFGDGADVEEPVRARVDQDFQQSMSLREGIREHDEREVVTLDNRDGELVVVGIDGRLVQDGSTIDPETLPIPNPWGDAPDTAPSVTAVPFAIGVVRAAWPAVPRATGYRVYASLTSPVDTSGTPNGTGAGTRFDIGQIGGVNIPMGDGAAPVFVKVVPFNPNGDGPVSNEASAVARQADNEFISAAYAYLGDVEASQISSGTLDAVVAIIGSLQLAGGNIDISPPTVEAGGELRGGIVIKDPANPSGEPLVRLHPNGCTFKGKMYADVLTVLQSLLVNGNARMATSTSFVASNGVPDPSIAPILGTGPAAESYAIPAVPSGYVHRAVTWDQAGGQWVQLLERSSDNRGVIRTISTSGVVGSLVVLAASGYGTQKRVTGIACIGGSVAVVNETVTSDGAGSMINRAVTMCDLATGAYQNRFVANAGYPGSTLQAGYSALGADGTYLYHAWADGGTSVSVRRFLPSPLSLAGGVVEVPIVDVDSTYLRSVEYGSFDFGAPKLVVSAKTSHAVYDLASWPTSGTTALTKNATLSWDADEAMIAAAWRPGQGWYDIYASLTPNRYSAYYPSGDSSWTAKYADTGASSTTTKPSPAATITVPKRRFVTVTLQPAPSGVTGGSVWVGYANSGTATTLYKRSEALTAGRVMVLTEGKRTTGSTTLPSTNTMGGSPATFESEVQGGNGWRGDGAGNFSVKTPTASAHAASKGYVDAGKTTTIAFSNTASTIGPYNASPDNVSIATRSGPLVTLVGQGKPGSSALTGLSGSSEASKPLIGTLPVGYRPSAIAVGIMQGSGNDFWTLRIDPDGNFYAYRYRSGTPTTSTWLPFTITFPTSDAMPA